MYPHYLLPVAVTAAGEYRRGMRPGIVGTVLDAAEGEQVDRCAALYGLRREPARLLGRALPWGQSDEALRSRTWHYDPSDKTLRIYP